MHDRETIFDYIEAESPQNAVIVDECMQHQVEILSNFPECGRLGRVEGTRELVIDRTPFVVVYRIEHNYIRILRVLHGAQQWPPELPGTSDL